MMGNLKQFYKYTIKIHKTSTNVKIFNSDSLQLSNY